MDLKERVKNLEKALKPFSEAAHRINYYDGERFNGSLYAMPLLGDSLTELLNGIDGEPLTVEHLREARKVLNEEAS